MFGREDYQDKPKAISRKLVSPSGDLGAKRAAEVSKAFPRGIKKDGEGNIEAFPMGKPRLTNSGSLYKGGTWPKGPDTMGGVIGGKSDKDSYQGKKAGRG